MSNPVPCETFERRLLELQLEISAIIKTEMNSFHFKFSIHIKGAIYE
jgi:hypothetical protein